MNWNDKEAVIAAANNLGQDMVVIRFSGRTNYNITHASRGDIYMKPGVEVIHRTSSK